ncbi:MAG: 50S ribosomal protein L19e [Candidatus Hydrothermarchaeaceae archaeon]
MGFNTQRRMAAAILNVGLGKVWFDPEDLESIASAVTREDIRDLINQGAIQVKMEDGQSSYWAKFRRRQRSKGRRKGHGKRSGAKHARSPKKERWISTIRPMRRMLKDLKDAEKIDNATHRRLYVMAKSGMFKSKSHLEAYIKDNKILVGES